MRKLIVSGLVVLVLGAMGARAATVTVDPLDLPGIGVGETFTVDLVGRSFDPDTETTIGGGTNVKFETAIIKFVSAVFNPIWDDGKYQDVSDGSVDVLAASFSNTASGDFLIATLSFEALAVGQTLLDLGPSSPEAPTPWVTVDSKEIAVTFLDGSVLVPLPPAVWLFLTGIGALGVLGRRRRA